MYTAGYSVTTLVACIARWILLEPSFSQELAPVTLTYGVPVGTVPYTVTLTPEPSLTLNHPVPFVVTFPEVRIRSPMLFNPTPPSTPLCRPNDPPPSALFVMPRGMM